MAHPYGVLPLEATGALEPTTNAARDAGLGRGKRGLAQLSDEVVMAILGNLTAKDLAILSTVSKALYVFCNTDDLYKGLLLEEFEGRWQDWTFEGSWQESYLAATVPSYTWGTRRPRPVAGLHSDLLYQPWLCTSMAIDPAWLEVENIDRRAGLSVEEFRERYERLNRPVILTDVVPKWPAVSKWDREYLQEAFRGKPVVVGDMPMSFDTYCAYSDANLDELPLYLFDKTFPNTAPHLAADYTVPDYFSEDLFSLLGDSRPDHRWIIIGPFKSGSTWHIDPNATHAWNGVVRGAKKWVMYPPHVTPPGVRPSTDGAEVSCPVSIMEWFIKFYEHKEVTGYRPLECTLREGELLFVPRGWWHLALNLEETVAVTQNYVGRSNLPQVLAFIGSRNEALVSGCAKGQRAQLYDRFRAALREKRPDLLDYVTQWEADRRKKAEDQAKLVALFKPVQQEEADGGGGGFSFGFCGAAAAKEEQEGKSGAGPASKSAFSFGFTF